MDTLKIRRNIFELSAKTKAILLSSIIIAITTSNVAYCRSGKLIDIRLSVSRTMPTAKKGPVFGAEISNHTNSVIRVINIEEYPQFQHDVIDVYIFRKENGKWRPIQINIPMGHGGPVQTTHYVSIGPGKKLPFQLRNLDIEYDLTPGIYRAHIFFYIDGDRYRSSDAYFSIVDH